MKGDGGEDHTGFLELLPQSLDIWQLFVRRLDDERTWRIAIALSSNRGMGQDCPAFIKILRLSEVCGGKWVRILAYGVNSLRSGSHSPYLFIYFKITIINS